MPTIPKGSHDIPAPGRLPTPFFQAQPPREIFQGGRRVAGAGAAADLGELEAVVRQERERARREADEIVLLEARSRLAKLESDLLIRAESRKGKDAFGLVEDTATEWAKATKDIASALPYDDQRRRFLALAQEVEARLQRNVFEHVARESAAWDAQKTGEFAGAERAAAVAAYENPERLELALKNVAEAYSGYAARNGKPPEWAEAVKRKAWTDVVQGAIYMSLTRRNLALASSYFDKYRPAIEPKAAVELSEAIERERFRRQVQDLSDTVLAPRHETIADALAMVDKVQDPRLRQAVEEEVKERWRLGKQAEQEALDNAIERAYKILESTGGDLRAIPAHLEAQLGLKGRMALEKLSAGLKKPFLDEAKRSEKIAEFWMLTDAQRAALTKADLLKDFRPYVTAQDFEEMVKTVSAARGKDYVVYNELSEPKKVALQELQTLGLFPLDEKKATDFEKQRFENTIRQLGIEVDLAKKQGKPLPDLRSHIRSIIGRGVLTPGDFLRGPQKKRFIDLTPRDRVVPPSEIRREIEADIRSRGKTPTDELVEKLYSARLWDQPRLYEEIMDEAR